MDEEELSYWIAKRFSDRLKRRSDQQQWRLDGKLRNTREIWMELIFPLIESGEIEISFQQNKRNMYRVFSKISFATYDLLERPDATRFI